MKMIDNKNKYVITILLLFISVLCSGCIKVNVLGKIDSDFMATYQGGIELNLSKHDYSQQALAQESMLKLNKYWQDIGYESQVTIDKEKYHIYFKKQKQCTSYEEAFEELFKLMTDEYSPFLTLSYEYFSYENYNEYGVYGSVDTRNVLDMEVYNTLQEDIKKTVDTEINSLDAVVEFGLPNHENINQIPMTDSTFKIELSPNEITEFNFQGKISNAALLDGDRNITDNSKYYRMLNYVLTCILVILVLLAIFLLTKLGKSR